MSRRSYDDPNTIEARQGVLDNRCENRRSKNHRTRNRSKKLNAIKRARGKAKAAINLVRARKFKAACRAYWEGENDEHP